VVVVRKAVKINYWYGTEEKCRTFPRMLGSKAKFWNGNQQGAYFVWNLASYLGKKEKGAY